MALRELQRAEIRYHDQQSIEDIMHQPGCRIGPFDQPPAELGENNLRWRICNTPRYSHDCDHKIVNPIQICASNPEPWADSTESSSPNVPNDQAVITRRTVTQCNVLATGPQSS